MAARLLCPERQRRSRGKKRARRSSKLCLRRVSFNYLFLSAARCAALRKPLAVLKTSRNSASILLSDFSSLFRFFLVLCSFPSVSPDIEASRARAGYVFTPEIKGHGARVFPAIKIVRFFSALPAYASRSRSPSPLYFHRAPVHPIEKTAVNFAKCRTVQRQKERATLPALCRRIARNVSLPRFQFFPEFLPGPGHARNSIGPKDKPD